MQLKLVDDAVVADDDLEIALGVHGTTNGYRVGCRCHRCREAKKRSNTSFVQPVRQCNDCAVEFVYEWGLTGQHRCAECMSKVRQERRRAELQRSRQRTCGNCGANYVYSSKSQHGTKYCADCTVRGRWELRRKLARVCPVCNSKHDHPNRLGVCSDCYCIMPRFIWDSFNRHKVPLDLVLSFAETLACEICGADLTVRALDSKKRLRPVHAVDHDHGCCPGGLSCGKCIRGILCRKCNVAIGYLNDDPTLARAAADYLKPKESGTK